MRLGHKVLLLLSGGMAVHALVVGHHTGSPSLLLMFAWGWVGVSVLRSEILDAEIMAATMVILLALTCLIVPFTPLWGPNSMAHYSAVLVPSLISWAAVFVYCRHLRTAPAEEATDWTAFDAPVEVSSYQYPRMIAANEAGEVVPSAPDAKVGRDAA